jgi:hypothetical protein
MKDREEKQFNKSSATQQRTDESKDQKERGNQQKPNPNDRRRDAQAESEKPEIKARGQEGKGDECCNK